MNSAPLRAAPSTLAAPPLLGRRGRTLAALALAGLAAALFLQLAPSQLIPPPSRWALAADFLAGALHPSFASDALQSPTGGLGAPLSILLSGLGRTLVFAAAATGLSLLCAFPLSLLASRSLGRPARWAPVRDRRISGLQRLGSAARSGLRLCLAAMRSVHELLWALLFLAALGLSDAAAVIAIAIPFTGTLAKVFSEFLDEAPVASGESLRAIGASPLLLFLVGRLPRVMPDMAAYAFYRFECAIRSAAILGFFGFPTLGYHLKNAFDSLAFGEVWAWLYALLAMVLLLEGWSSALRRRFVA
ncbi:MAG: ABC transporter permease subunit [Planctomycetota bacterium]|nr:hypothetical protein [Planctomycetota bacterium]MDP6519326.1 ABC transporter permease subunit [Planctomycetota bacterium]MDP6838104.1 ABC transporter permease subunit [Planctomycetota bacterium]